MHAIVLAAGAGSRFGGGKLLASWRGEPLIAGALRAACASPASTVTLVSGADPAVEAQARRIAPRLLAYVRAERWAEGVSASLRAGFGAVPPDAAGVFVFLADMPRTPLAIAGRLADALSRGAAAAAPACEGRRGHPVLVGAALFAHVAGLSGDEGLGRVLARLGPRLALVPTDDDGVLFDIDSRETLEATA